MGQIIGAVCAVSTLRSNRIMDFAGLNTPIFEKEQANWQLRQPRQFFTLTTRWSTRFTRLSSLWSVDDFQSVSFWIIEVSDLPAIARLTNVVEGNLFGLKHSSSLIEILDY